MRTSAAALLLAAACTAGSVRPDHVWGVAVGHGKLEQCRTHAAAGEPTVEECLRIEGPQLSEPAAGVLSAAASGLVGLWRSLWRLGAAE